MLLFSFDIYGQVSAAHTMCVQIPEIALMDVEPDNSAIQLNLNIPLEAGNAVSSSTNSSKWINYSSSKPSGGASRSILSQTLNALPDGIALTLIASNYSGGGSGTLGFSSGSINLSTSPMTIISSIGRGYTGNGQNNGHQLTFSLAIEDYEKLDANQSKNVTVIYTIVD